MNLLAKLILGAVATGCIAVGVAAQTGTIHLHRASASGGVSGPQQTAAPPSHATPTVSPSPERATLAASAGGDEGDGDDNGGD